MNRPRRPEHLLSPPSPPQGPQARPSAWRPGGSQGSSQPPQQPWRTLVHEAPPPGPSYCHRASDRGLGAYSYLRDATHSNNWGPLSTVPQPQLRSPRALCLPCTLPAPATGTTPKGESAGAAQDPGAPRGPSVAPQPSALSAAQLPEAAPALAYPFEDGRRGRDPSQNQVGSCDHRPLPGSWDKPYCPAICHCAQNSLPPPGHSAPARDRSQPLLRSSQLS